jgi:hypothetical protein
LEVAQGKSGYLPVCESVAIIIGIVHTSFVFVIKKNANKEVRVGMRNSYWYGLNWHMWCASHYLGGLAKLWEAANLIL